MAKKEKNEKLEEFLENLPIDKDYYITSLELAEIMGKRHSNMLNDIKQESEELRSLGGIDVTKLFDESFYITRNNRRCLQFKISTNGVLQLMSRYARRSFRIRCCIVKLHGYLNREAVFYDMEYYERKKEKFN